MVVVVVDRAAAAAEPARAARRQNISFFAVHRERCVAGKDNVLEGNEEVKRVEKVIT